MRDCPKCGTDHDGYEPGTYGAEVRCLRLQAQGLGADHLVDQIDTLERERRRCGFCISGSVPAVQGEPPTHEICPHCNGSRTQEARP